MKNFILEGSVSVTLCSSVSSSTDEVTTIPGSAAEVPLAAAELLPLFCAWLEINEELISIIYIFSFNTDWLKSSY